MVVLVIVGSSSSFGVTGIIQCNRKDGLKKNSRYNIVFVFFSCPVNIKH